MSRAIGTLNEKPLHASLKEWYSKRGDEFEVSVDGFVIDLVRKRQLIEIHTGRFFPIRRKMEKLLTKHKVRLVYPVAGEKYILKRPKKKKGEWTRRRSPKRGTIEEMFHELVSIPTLIRNPRFSLEVLLTREEEVRRYDGRLGWRRRGWVIEERRLLDVMDRRLFKHPRDMCALIPEETVEPFRTKDLAAAMDRPVWLARMMAYCLREMGAITQVGKAGNWFLYTRSDNA